MSRPGKKVVDVAFKASKNIDWEGMAKLLVSDEVRKEFATLRRTFDEVNSTLQTKFSQFYSLYKSIGMFWVVSYTMAQPACETVMNWLSSGGVTELLPEANVQPNERFMVMREVSPLPISLLSGFSMNLYLKLVFQMEESLFAGQHLAQRNASLLSKPAVTLLVLEIVNYRLLPPYRFGWSFEGFTVTNVIYSSIAGVEIPKFVDTVTPQYKPKFDELLVELKEAEEKSLKESERLEKEIAEVQELKQKISTMTADEYFEKHPELKKKFDDEIRNDYWGY
ncbi:hypothetical protein ES332_A10G151000v1 [Gossypium tomentosum]|uniref:Uncharacterized protein n=1 Tax=Gossypium tomentosum TaxID=34277 RepID=A0A5D2NQ88_GOSTO|nr:hypothetical protein ES332_A10G151000v1 [Gossypium tomentosum]